MNNMEIYDYIEYMLNDNTTKYCDMKMIIKDETPFECCGKVICSLCEYSELNWWLDILNKYE